MDKKIKIHLTNEEVVKKFKSNFDLVNYAIQLADNMIRTGRDARVKSEIQNRAMLILEEIHEGKDHFDEIDADIKTSSIEIDMDSRVPVHIAYEEIPEKRKHRLPDIFDGDE